MKKILQKEQPVLRLISVEVPISDIHKEKIKKIINEMSHVLSKQDDGVALAAPQIGESVRIFIVSGRLLWFINNPDIPDEDRPDKYPSDMVYINPKIVKLSKEKEWVEEGCLSVRYLYGKIKRSSKATVVAYDENGKKFQRGASGVLAQVFQHEIDHLNGKLFIDEAKDIEDLPPESSKVKIKK